MTKAVFIEKDGTLIHHIPNNVDPEKITLEEHVAEGLSQLKKEQYLFIIVSNQTGIANGLFKDTALANVQQKIVQLLLPYHITINGFYYCPHHPDGKIKDYSVNCFCRKPQPGLILRAAKDFNIDLSRSWMIGNTLNDVEAGKKAGCKTLLINNGTEKEWLINDQRLPDFEVGNFKEAVHFIVNGPQVQFIRNEEQRRASI